MPEKTGYYNFFRLKRWKFVGILLISSPVKRLSVTKKKSQPKEHWNFTDKGLLEKIVSKINGFCE